MTQYTRDQLIEQFQDGVYEFVFKTKSGAETTKMATLRSDLLPPAPVNEEADENDELKKKRKVNTEVVNFWSVEDGGWRSCRLENIVSVKRVDEAAAVAKANA